MDDETGRRNGSGAAGSRRHRSNGSGAPGSQSNRGPRPSKRATRLLTGMFYQESNSLAPKPASFGAFADTLLLEGPDVVARLRGTATEIGGIIAAAEAAGVAILPTLAAKAVSAGHVTRDAFERITGRLLDRIGAAQLTGPIDAVVLALHGATVVESIDDGAGEVLRRVRAVVGPDCPVTATLDLHANVTPAMVAAADALVAYHTYPHTDLYETGRRAATLALEIARGSIRPTSALRRLPMILPAENAATDGDGPLAALVARAREIERQPGVLAVSVTQTQPWLNVYDVACSVLVVTDGEPARAERYAEALAAEYWERRHGFYDFDLVPLHEAVRRALAAPYRPVVLADTADGTGSGSSGDSTAILQALIHEGATGVPALLSIVDPVAVDLCAQAGAGATVTLAVGGRIDRARYRPCRVTGTVRRLSDGTFTFKGPQFTGEPHHRGPTAVLAVGAIQIVLTSKTAFNWDPEFYRSLGLEPAEAQIVVVKSPVGFRAAYAGVMAGSILVDTPGSSTPNIRSLAQALDRVRRPIYPFDPIGESGIPAVAAGAAVPPPPAFALRPT